MIVEVDPTTQKMPEVEKNKPPQLYPKLKDWSLPAEFEALGQKSFRGGSRRAPRSYKVAVWSLVAASIDIFMSAGIFFIFVFSFSFLVKKKFGVVLLSLNQGHWLVLLYALAVGVSLYMIMLRIFFGATIGESSCALRLGWPYQAKQTGYSLKVISRSLLFLCTGLIIFPVLALITGIDWAGRLTKLPLIEDSYPRI